MRHARLVSGVALLAATLLSGCFNEQTAQNASANPSTPRAAGLILPSGTAIDVTLATALTSETASIGSAWNGSTRSASMLDGHNVIPAGSSVSGTVTGVTPARRGDRAMLDLGLASITVGAHNYAVRGSMESVVAGSTRARNLGAIGAATVVGAIIGHQVDHSNTGTAIGAVVGAGAATGVVANTKGWQVVLKEGTPLTFTTNEAVAVRP
jgi:hypothetical protein